MNQNQFEYEVYNIGIERITEKLYKIRHCVERMVLE